MDEEHSTTPIPAWYAHVRVGMAIYLAYVVGGTMAVLPLFSALLARWPDPDMAGGAPATALVGFFLAGLLVLPGLILGAVRGRPVYLLAGALAPFVVTAIWAGHQWARAEIVGSPFQLGLLAKHVIPRVCTGTLFAAAWASYARRTTSASPPEGSHVA